MDTVSAPEKQRRGGRKFTPGNSGNPAGRPKGSRNTITLAIEALLEGEHEKLTRKAIDMALAGDGPALRLCLERLAPPRKDAPITIDLPAVNSAEDTVAASSAVLAAVGAGEKAGRVMTLLTAHRAIVEVGNLERRLTALEAAK